MNCNSDTYQPDNSELPTDLSKHSILRQELENRPSGLSLLVAAVDAQDPEFFRSRPSSVHSMEGSVASSQSPYSESNPNRDIQNSDSNSVNGESSSKSGRRRSIPDNEKDEQYWEKRRRNNEAAKRSREKRRLTDMAMESRLMELSKENSILKTELIHKVQPVPVIAENSIQSSANSPFVPVKPEPRHNLPHAAAPLPPQLPYVSPQIRAPTQAAAPAETMLPNPPVPTNPLTGLHAPQNTAAPPQHSALAAALNAHPATALPQSLLTAMLPPSAVLQHLSAAYTQAQAAALLAAQQRTNNAFPTVTTAALQPNSTPLFIGTQQQNGHQQQPQIKEMGSDLNAERLLMTRTATAPAVVAAQQSSDINSNHPNSPHGMDGKQYLRYKLLEKQQNKRLPAAGSAPSTAILGSLLTSGRLPAQKAEPDSSSVRETVINGHGSVESRSADSNLSIKQCLSNLAVHLGSDQSTGSRHSDSSLTGSEGSLISPASSHEAESNTSSASQHSPPHAILNALGAANGGGNSRETSTEDRKSSKRHFSESERYMERRRRNNEAAKRCRANRRALFEYRFKRAQELEQENVQLKEEMQRLSRELMELKELLTKKNGRNGLTKSDPTENGTPEQNGRQENGNSCQENGNLEQGGVATSPSRDSGNEMSSESGNDENQMDGRGLVIAEDLSCPKMEQD